MADELEVFELTDTDTEFSVTVPEFESDRAEKQSFDLTNREQIKQALNAVQRRAFALGLATGKKEAKK